MGRKESKKEKHRRGRATERERKKERGRPGLPDAVGGGGGHSGG